MRVECCLVGNVELVFMGKADKLIGCVCALLLLCLYI